MTKPNDGRLAYAYYTDVRQSRLLSAKDERALFNAYRTCPKCAHGYRPGDTVQLCPKCGARRDLNARDRIVEGALRYVVKVAMEYTRKVRGHVHEDDLVQMLTSAGNLGLLVAVDRFDLSRNTKFLTYAAWWVREKILEELDNSGLVRVPAYRQKALRAKRKYGDGVDLDDPYVTLTQLADVDDARCDDELETDTLNDYGTEVIRHALKELNLRSRDQYVILAYYGAHEAPKNLQQISKRLGLSSERVRQIKETLSHRLREYLHAHKNIGSATDVFS
jgi:RNA polymerase sigma factor (sigma-70 family)